MHEALNKPHWTSLRSVHRVSRSVDVDRPIREVYDQWTRFEDFPKFMFGVKEVVQLDANHLRWKASVWGRTEEWVAEITEQQPDSRISWKSISGVPSAGTVRFHSLGEGRTRVTLAMAYQPRGLIERAGDALGFLEAQVQNACDDFKLHMETRDAGKPGWRGAVIDGQTRLPAQ